MFTLLGEVNLWTFDDNLSIKDTDFGAFRYHDKRIDSVYEEGKRSYCQKRGMVYTPSNKRGNKLKDSIKYLEEQLKDNSLIFCQWYDHCIIQLVLSNGLLIQIQISVVTGDIEKITVDKYLLGKTSDHMSDVMITKNHLVCTYNDNRITLVSFTKPKRHVFDKIGKLEPKISTTNLCGPNGRRLDKKIRVNKSDDLILIWWKTTMNEVYPWSPTVKEHDRANIHLYRLSGIKLDLICYVRTEYDPMCIVFDACHDNIIHSIEQKVSRKGEVTIEWRTHEISQQDKLQRITMISVPLPTHTSCVRLSPNQENLLLCCIDGSMMLYDRPRGTSATVKAAFIPTLASWHSDGIMFAVGNDRGQFQHFDLALTCIKSEILNEETTPANILDLSSYFSRHQPVLIRMEWNKKRDPVSFVEDYYQSNSLFLLVFERGPIGVIKVIEADDFSGDTLVRRYLSLSQVEQATSLLLSMNWDTYPSVCMHSLNQILNHLFKLPLTTDRENLIQNALGSFHVPITPISQTVEDEYGEEVRDLTRRFFHHLLRYRMFEKAFRLAIDLNDHDLFMDIHFYALVVNDMEMATAAKEKAEQILSRSSSYTSSHSTCSRESCSLCSGSSSDKGEESYSEESEDYPKEDEGTFKRSNITGSSQIPPLPVLHPPRLSTKSFIPPSMNDPTSVNTTDCNLMSTPFNMPAGSLGTTAYNHSSRSSVPNTFFASTSFDIPHKSYRSPSLGLPTDNSHILRNFSDNLMSTSFVDLSLNEVEPTVNQCTRDFVETTYNRYKTNDIQCTFDSAMAMTSIGDNSFMSTPFNTSKYKSASIDNPSVLPSTAHNTESNVMSTSFSTLTGNAEQSNLPDYTVSLLRNAKSYRYNIDSPSGTVPRPNVMNNSKSNLYKAGNNVMSTSFNYPLNNVTGISNDSPREGRRNESNYNVDKPQLATSGKQREDCDIPPPPPSLTPSLTNYLNNLPRKNNPLSRSTPGLTNAEETFTKFSPSRGTINSSRILQRQSSVSNILQNHRENSRYVPPSVYRLNYDLDYIPYHGSCDTLNAEYFNGSNTRLGSSLSGPYRMQQNYIAQSKSLESKLQRLRSQSGTSLSKDTRLPSNVPPLPVINLSSSNPKISSSGSAFVETTATPSEKPKVKFSDTVTHILVPGTGQTHRHKRTTTVQSHITDPKRELAESLPLCLGNEDYLKDFQPLSKDTEKASEASKSDESTKIKVVHFGLL